MIIIAAVALLAVASRQSDVERVAFSCHAGDHVATVVRSGSVLAYRSMRRARLELQIVGGTIARTGYSGGGEVQVVFRNGPWTYVVYQRTLRTGFDGRNNPSFEAGVDVLRNSTVIGRRRCDHGDVQFDDRAISGLPEGQFVDH